MVDLRKLGVLVLLALDSRGLVVLGEAWVLLLGVIVLGLAILLGLGVLECRSFLALEDCSVFGYSLMLVLVFLLRYWIHILRSLRPGLGLESVLELEVLLPFLMGRQALVSIVLVQREGLG